MRLPFFNRRHPQAPGPPPCPPLASLADHPSARGQPTPLAAEGAALANEVEAWANGALAELRSTSPLVMSPWLVLNRLAHADPAVVRRLAGDDEPEGSSPLRRNPTWAAAERGLARHIVVDGDRPADIELLQRGVLVPLELRLIQRAQAETLTLGQVVAAVFRSLGQRRLDH